MTVKVYKERRVYPPRNERPGLKGKRPVPPFRYARGDGLEV